MSQIRILASGVDSLYFSARGELFDGLLVLLGRMREANPDQEIPFAFHGSDRNPDMILHPFGRRGYKFRLSSRKADISLGASEQFPAALIELRSAYIHSVGLERAVDETVELLARDLFPHGCRLVVSRVDVFADQQGWEPRLSDYPRFVCRAIRQAAYDFPATPYMTHGRFSGFAFGRGDVVARIYNKTVEMQARGDTWPELMWVGRDVERDVWRVEFQFRREALKQFGITGPEDLLRHRQGLWRYGLSWLSLRKRVRDGTRSRWPVDEDWQALKAAALGGVASQLIRQRIHESDVLRLTQGLVGYATSLQAMGETKDLAGVVAREIPTARDYLRHKGVKFDEIVDEKRRKILDRQAVQE
jgi:hypothetical protein